jgi:hypothetical protein
MLSPKREKVMTYHVEVDEGGEGSADFYEVRTLYLSFLITLEP